MPLAPFPDIRPVPIEPFIPGAKGNPFALVLDGFLTGLEQRRERTKEDQLLALALRDQMFQEMNADRQFNLANMEALRLADYRDRSLALHERLGEQGYLLDVTRLGFEAQRASHAIAREQQAMEAGKLALQNEMDAAALRHQRYSNAVREVNQITGKSFGGLPITDTYDNVAVSTFSHAEDLSVLDGEDNALSGIDGRPTHDRAGAAIPKPVLQALGIDPKKARVRFQTGDGRTHDLPVVDYGTAERIFNRQGPTLDLTPKAIEQIGGSIFTEGKRIVGASLANVGNPAQGGLSRLSQIRIYDEDKGLSEAPVSGVIPPESDVQAFKRLDAISQMKTRNPDLDPKTLALLEQAEANIRDENYDVWRFHEANRQLGQLRGVAVGSRRSFLETQFFKELGQLEQGQPLDDSTLGVMAGALSDVDPSKPAVTGAEKERLPHTVQTKLNSAFKISRRADEALETLKGLPEGTFNPLLESAKRLGERFNAMSFEKDKNLFLQLRQDIANKLLKEESGASVTDQEMRRFIEAIGDPSKMTESTFRQRTETWLEGLKSDYQTEILSWEQAGYFIPDILQPSGFDVRTTPTPVSPENLAPGEIRSVSNPSTGESRQVRMGDDNVLYWFGGDQDGQPVE